jgi:hypothetical protein
VTEEKWKVAEPTTLRIEGSGRLEIGNVAGSIEVVAHDEPWFDIEIDKIVGRKVRIHWADGHLRIKQPFSRRHEWGSSRRTRSRIRVTAPRDSRIELNGISSGLSATGFTADVRLSSVSGGVAVRSSAGLVEANSVSGSVEVTAHRGDVQARSVSGHVVASGELPSFTGHTVSGAITVESTTEIRSISASTVSGSVVARVPAELDVSYTVSTMSGSVEVDGQRIDAATRWGGNRSGRTGGAGPLCTFHAGTVSGAVRIDRTSTLAATRR